jgi:hypothetical protein
VRFQQIGHLDEIDLAYAITIHKSQGSEVGKITMESIVSLIRKDREARHL